MCKIIVNVLEFFYKLRTGTINSDQDRSGDQFNAISIQLQSNLKYQLSETAGKMVVTH